MTSFPCRDAGGPAHSGPPLLNGRGPDETGHAGLAAACAYLLGAQHPAGSWTDFWLPVGTSDAWVTAYTGLALHAVSACPRLARGLRAQALGAAGRAADWLLVHVRSGGWGYNAATPIDADSTAHAVSLLARLGRPVPPQALTALHAHAVAGQGFCTYAWSHPDHAWTRPSPDVTAAALRALADVGELDREDLRRSWQATVAVHQHPDGGWSSPWWTTPSYPTGLALEVWRQAGRPALPRLPPTAPNPPGSFDLAWTLHARALLGDRPGARRAAAALLGRQEADGGWPSLPVLRLPPARPGGAPGTLFGQDARRVFTTASAVRALALAPNVLSGAGAGEPPRRAPRETGPEVRRLVQRSARALGFSPSGARAAGALFADLTRVSLAAPSPWPARQLSALSGGAPVEWSVEVGPEARQTLRYAAEVGAPFQAPPMRARSAVVALEGTARRLGYGGAWARAEPAVAALTAPDLPVPDGLRFWVWGGVDQVRPTPGQSAPCPVLKVYLNLLHRELGGGRGRLEAALGAAGLPLAPRTREALDLLDAAGFPHELGFGLGPGGRLACKIYYELPGWSRPLAARLLRLSGLPHGQDGLCPELPGLLRETLAAHSRAGMGLRLDPTTGEICEIMAAAAFPPPLLPLAETVCRVEAWFTAQGWDARAYRALCAVLMPSWPDADTGTRALHSLLTRTVSAGTGRTAVYLRPGPNTALVQLGGGSSSSACK